MYIVQRTWSTCRMQDMADFSQNMANGYTLAKRLARTWLMDIL